MLLEMSFWFLTAAGSVFFLGALVSRKRPAAIALPVLAAMALMLLLTAIFDNLMIFAGLFDYGTHTLSGLRIGLAPIEDFAYAACAVLLGPGLWWLFEALASRRTDSGHSISPHDKA